LEKEETDSHSVAAANYHVNIFKLQKIDRICNKALYKTFFDETKYMFMKQAIIILLFTVSTVVAAYAQPEAGTFSLIPHVGVSLSKISEDPIFTGASIEQSVVGETKMRSGVTAGLDLQYQINHLTAVSVGVGYAREGIRYETSDLTDKEAGSYLVPNGLRVNLDYVRVPFLLHLYLVKGLAVKAGVQLGFLTGHKLKGDMRSVTINKDHSYEYSTETEKIDEDFALVRPFDLDIPLGVSYEYENVVVQAQYNLGITNLYKKQYDLSGKNRSLYLTVGYKFNL
jgi:hypothetical protein